MNEVIEIRLTQNEATGFISQLDRFLYSDLGLAIKAKIEAALHDEGQWECPTCGGTAWRKANGDS